MARNEILVVYKKSLLQIYKERNPKEMRSKLKQDKNFCDCIMRSDKSLQSTIQTVEKILKSKGLKYKKMYRGKITHMLASDLVICVGGDGSFLQVAHHMDKGEIMLVNSDPLQSVAFYSCCTSNDFESRLDLYQRGKLSQNKLYRLKLVLDKKEIPEKPLNDILIAHQNPAAVTRYFIRRGRNKEEQKSSGIWISAPGGSTAAIHSAGGKIMGLESKKFQYLVREPYGGGKKLHLRKGILTHREKLHLSSRTRRSKIYIDGNHLTYEFGLLSNLEISLYPKPLIVLGLKEKTTKYKKQSS
ncbi:MAG: NAD(+)/NADH kinase [Nanoarchaeota archaeon]|nr:NAD(+)/NADH kinase [Nanoarchaeota archaeon]